MMLVENEEMNIELYRLVEDGKVWGWGVGWGGKFCTCTQKEVTKNRVVYSEELEGVKGRFRETKKEQSGIKYNYVS